MVRGRERSFKDGLLRPFRRPLAAILAAGLVLGVALVGAGAASADTVLFSDGFESGNFSWPGLRWWQAVVATMAIKL